MALYISSLCRAKINMSADSQIELEEKAFQFPDAKEMRNTGTKYGTGQIVTKINTQVNKI